MNVDAHAEECFFDTVSSGMKMGLTFEVVEGGFLDIDVKVVLNKAHYSSLFYIVSSILAPQVSVKPKWKIRVKYNF